MTPTADKWHGHLAHASHGRPARGLAAALQGQDAPATHGRDAHATLLRLGVSRAEAQAAAPVLAAIGVPANLLQGGEVVILAIKPSGWFVLLASWPVLVVAALLCAAAYFAAGRGISVDATLIYTLCPAVACARLVMAMIQWMGRLYVLTNLRLMLVRGVARADVTECLLPRVVDVRVSRTGGERLLRLGSLSFRMTDGNYCPAAWACVAKPEQVRDEILKAMRKLRGR